MPRDSVWNLVRPERPAQTRTITDPEQPGYSLELTLRGLDGVTGLRASALTVEYIQRWCTGETDAAGKVTKPPESFGAFDGKPYQPDEPTCRAFAHLQTMWAGPEKERPDPAEMAGWQVMLPTGWFDILEFIAELNRPRGLEGNPSGTATSDCSAESSPATATPS